MDSNKVGVERERWARDLRIFQMSVLFVVGTIFDLTISLISYGKFGAIDLNPLASHVVASTGYPGLAAAKLLLMTIFVFACLLASASRQATLARASERALRAGTIIVWVVQLWSLVNIIAEIAYS